MTIRRIRTITLLCTVLAVSCLSLDAQVFKRRSVIKKENLELRQRIDSLMIEIDELQSTRSAEDSIISEMLGIYGENEDRQFEYTQEVTDSLLSLWYVHRQVGQSSADEEDMDLDSVKLSSNVSDSVLIQRLKKMNSYISLPFNETVRNYMVLYSEKMPTKMGHILGLCSYYMPIFEDIFNRYGLPDELKYLAIIESALNPVATSRAGAKGMWQFMYNTAKSYGLKINSFVDERLDVEKAADAAARYLTDAYNVFGDWCLAISAYNCGSGNVNKAIRRSGGKRDFWSIYPYLPKETRLYMPAFVGAMYALNYSKEYGLVPDGVQMPAYTDTFEIHRNLHFEQISHVVGIPMEELQNLNPQYIKNIVPGNEGTQILKLPYNYSNAFIDRQDSLYSYKADVLLDQKTITNIKNGTDGERITYKVKSGDYLGKIAAKYGVTVSKLKSWNHLRSDNLRVGQTLYIYRNGPGPVSSSTANSSTNSKTATAASGVYVVKSGDSLYKIAQKFPGISAEDIMKYNGITSDIKPGMKLNIPKK